ncbi:hypothetical protein [Lysobacter sp. N42]|jgi:hypothetical protein|uniref:hypothetical protein n=1 Tax=Lysobacter sp. N42 TaxID=2545719 RepID=UPI0010490424|nr:hypothetical protein [Lysobacter sp. N42]TCZ88417.1 hypothetical protein EYQ95_14290 [Lysobacter sp. N42]
MTRKLRNSLNALLLASAACMLGAVTLAALPVGTDAGTPARVTASPAVGLQAQAPAGQRKARRTHRMRPSLGMPYFSFVPRG